MSCGNLFKYNYYFLNLDNTNKRSCGSEHSEGSTEVKDQPNLTKNGLRNHNGRLPQPHYCMCLCYDCCRLMTESSSNNFLAEELLEKLPLLSVGSTKDSTQLKR